MLPYALFDTHTHFDVEEFALDRIELAQQAKARGVEKLLLIGFVAERFQALQQTQQQLQQVDQTPQCLLAPGLHPVYVEQHRPADLQALERFLNRYSCVAIGEIGLDRFLPQHKNAAIQAQQQQYFMAQIELAKRYDLPVLLHIRKAHAECLAILKQLKFQHGGIAHAFSGGVEEAKALVKLGFKLGITGQITQPNAKKLLQVVQQLGAEHLVIETDCPDMTPRCCYDQHQSRQRNTPANLPYVLTALAEVLQMPCATLAEILWRNSHQALRL
ncbi:TatD family hydrolase [Acinetobacter larvae]|uniref:Hydrolase n=1 Tax=Acinetobacter larvae TaxID=1789224 RepID=A0A1B2M2A3_9GAMM|nr:TatD family hydrolase [Acinetobacter larvae]AOA59317.1 hydrolase [Acinetobacter larvae]